MSWGIAETASELEKLKSESADYLNGLNSCGEIDYSTYSEAFDFYADLIEKAYRFGKDTNVPSNDLISRQAAIDAVEEQLDYLQMLNKYENPTAESKWYGVNWARNTIADLPPAQPEAKELQDVKVERDYWKQRAKYAERKKGEWIEQDDGWDAIYYECSVCKEPFMLFDGTPQDNLYNFCPCCGADMRIE